MKIILNDYLKDKIDIFSMYSQNSDESLGKLFVYLIQKKKCNFDWEYKKDFVGFSFVWVSINKQTQCRVDEWGKQI